MKKDAVLIIDDDNRNVFALTAVLKAKGYTTLSAADAVTGISMLNEDTPAGIVLMDMMMPGMDGYEAISLLKCDTRYTDLPVIAVTAQTMPGDRERCIAAGANDYLSKPVDIDLLMRLLDQYL
jgi:CheY-like chemotaxis protein